MLFSEFRRYLEDGSFFERLDRDARDRRAGSWWPWLHLLKTGAIEAWARAPSARAARRAVGLRAGPGEPVLGLLLAATFSTWGADATPDDWPASGGGPSPEDPARRTCGSARTSPTRSTRP